MKQSIINLKNRLFAITFLRFFLSGVLSFLIDTGILISLKAFAFNGVDVKILGTISLAKLISGTVGIILMFALNRVWVFTKSKEGSLKKQTAKYLIFTFLNLIFASILFSFYSTLVLQFFGNDIASHLTISVTLANLFTEGTKMVISFFAYKYLVFR